jgi:trk system potassium uptake protein TrkA
MPTPDDVLEAGDELLFTANRTSENSLLAAIHGGEFLREVVSEEP